VNTKIPIENEKMKKYGFGNPLKRICPTYEKIVIEKTERISKSMYRPIFLSFMIIILFDYILH
jgi:hypothetical protein